MKRERGAVTFPPRAAVGRVGEFHTSDNEPGWGEVNKSPTPKPSHNALCARAGGEHAR
jgi:hypothetical protein